VLTNSRNPSPHPMVKGCRWTKGVEGEKAEVPFVPSEDTVYAVFDLDDTLLRGDSALLWSEFVCREGLVPNKDQYLKREAELFAQYAKGQMDMDDYMTNWLSPLKGMDRDTLATHMSTFIDK
ncbi:hypothetical protein KIPB_012482, partial [Kipferlia bialata]